MQVLCITDFAKKGGRGCTSCGAAEPRSCGAEKQRQPQDPSSAFGGTQGDTVGKAKWINGLMDYRSWSDSATNFFSARWSIARQSRCQFAARTQFEISVLSACCSCLLLRIWLPVYRFLGTSCRFFAFGSSYPRMGIMRTLQKNISREPRGIYDTSRQVSTDRILRNEQNTSSFPSLASSEVYLWSRVVNELN